VERRSFLKKAGVGLAAGVAAAPGLSQAQTADLPEIKWRMPSSFSKTMDVFFGGAELICKRVAEMTDNKFQIRPFAPGELVGALQVLDAVQNGTVECGHTATHYYMGKDPAFAIGCTIPFGMNTRQMNAWWYYGGGAEAMAPLLKEYNCMMFPCGNTGTQMGGWYRKEIKTVADLKGLKFRVGGLAGLALAKLGVVPQQIAGPDIYPALEKGTIDAVEWNGPYDDEKLGFNKIAQYYYYPAWWEGQSMIAFLVNDKKWSELPKPYKAALEAACGEANVRMMADFDTRNPQALRRLIASGTKLRPLPKAVMEASEKAVYELYDELSEKSAHWKRIYPEWKKFRDEQFLWFRVAENTYDNYVFNSKVGSASAKK
jgi:TRAP-type mannitol/chloroaromatic compound transport system substrate-binding protein